MRSRLTVSWLAALVAVGLTATLSVGIATAAQSSSGVKACVTKNGVLVLATKKDRCPHGDKKRTIGARGPQGTQGKQGIQGVQGKPGNPGPGAIALSYAEDATDSAGLSAGSIDGYSFSGSCTYVAGTTATTDLVLTPPSGVTVNLFGNFVDFSDGKNNPVEEYGGNTSFTLFGATNRALQSSVTLTGSDGHVFQAVFFIEGVQNTNLDIGQSHCLVMGTVTPAS
jgi:hypothetical protein